MERVFFAFVRLFGVGSDFPQPSLNPSSTQNGTGSNFRCPSRFFFILGGTRVVYPRLSSFLAPLLLAIPHAAPLLTNPALVVGSFLD